MRASLFHKHAIIVRQGQHSRGKMRASFFKHSKGQTWCGLWTEKRGGIARKKVEPVQEPRSTAACARKSQPLFWIRYRRAKHNLIQWNERWRALAAHINIACTSVELCIRALWDQEKKESRRLKWERKQFFSANQEKGAVRDVSVHVCVSWSFQHRIAFLFPANAICVAGFSHFHGKFCCLT